MSLRTAVLTLGLGVFVAAHALPAGAADATPQATGYKADLLMWIGAAESKLNQLAEAMPESAYSWRPGEGVRSVGEVFMHVAGANYGIPSFWGVKPPAGFDFRTYEKSLTAKAEIRKALADSFVHLKSALAAASEADLEKPAEFFGMKSTVRGGYFLILSHVHEHLGQSIAYARSNGVVPPWSAAETVNEKAAAPKKGSPQK